VTTEDRIIRGKSAEQFLSNPLMDDAFTSIEAEIVNDWKQSGGLPTADREAMFIKLSVLSEVKAKLESFINDGKISQNRLNMKTL
jgi:hypothetical protein